MRNGSASPSSQSAPEEPASNASSPALPNRKKITVVNEADTNSRVSGDILSGLTEELAREQSQAGEVAIAEAKGSPAALAEESLAAPAEASPAAPAEESLSQEEPALSDKSFLFINVMEELVKSQDLDKFAKDYQVCSCSRCKADICALALTRLPAKYVVAEEDSMPPLLSYYRNRYRVPILTQLVRACIQVRENPRHER